MCFQSHIKPAWEDPANKAGGEIRLFFSKQAQQSVDTVWISMLLAAVGETLAAGDEFNVCGLTVSRKKFKSKISIWIDSCAPEARVALESAIRSTIGGPLLDQLGVGLEWTGHQQLLEKEHSKESFQMATRGKRRLDRPPSAHFAGSSH